MTFEPGVTPSRSDGSSSGVSTGSGAKGPLQIRGCPDSGAPARLSAHRRVRDDTGATRGKWRGGRGRPGAAQQPSSSCGARPSAITILLAAGTPIRRFTRPFFPGRTRAAGRSRSAACSASERPRCGSLRIALKLFIHECAYRSRVDPVPSERLQLPPVALLSDQQAHARDRQPHLSRRLRLGQPLAHEQAPGAHPQLRTRPARAATLARTRTTAVPAFARSGSGSRWESRAGLPRPPPPAFTRLPTALAIRVSLCLSASIAQTSRSISLNSSMRVIRDRIPTVRRTSGPGAGRARDPRARL